LLGNSAMDGVLPLCGRYISDLADIECPHQAESARVRPTENYPFASDITNAILNTKKAESHSRSAAASFSELRFRVHDWARSITAHAMLQHPAHTIEQTSHTCELKHSKSFMTLLAKVLQSAKAQIALPRPRSQCNLHSQDMHSPTFKYSMIALNL
jgi:hypothetical protein